MVNLFACIERTGEIYNFLCEKLKDDMHVTLGKLDSYSFIFKVFFPVKKAIHTEYNCYSDILETKMVEFDGIQISVPPNVEGNREGEPVCIFKIGISLGQYSTNVSSIGYEECRSFDNMEDIYQEIKRLADL
jgi:hypothetical protein